MNRLQHIILYVFIGVVVSFLVYGASQTIGYDHFLSIQNRIDDSCFSIRGKLMGNEARANGEIIIVDIDDRSMNVIGNFDFWPRLLLGKVIGRLKKDGAKLVFLDMYLKGGMSEADNQALADSIWSVGNVFSGYYLKLTPESIQKRPIDIVLNDGFPFNGYDSPPPGEVDFLISREIVYSYREMIMTAERLGFTNYMPDRDGVTRHMPLFISHKNMLFTSISLQMWLYVNDYHYTDAVITSRGLRFGETFIPTDKHCYMRINYHNDGGSFTYIPFLDVLAGNFKDGTFRDKIVLIGSSSKRLKDIKEVPGGRTIPGVEIHGAALSTLLHEDFLTVSSGKAILVGIILTGIFSSLFFRYTHPVRFGLPVIIAAPFILYGLAVYRFIFSSRIINVIAPMLIMFILYGISLYLYLHERHEKRKSNT